MIATLLENLPVDRAFFWSAGAVALLLATTTLWLRSTASGRRVLGVVAAAENGLLALLVAAMILFSFLQVVLRNLADTGFVWIDPLLRHLVLWVGFLGALLATRSGRHINIDALTRLLPAPAMRASAVVTNALACVVALLLANACAKLVREEFLAATDGFLHVPVWLLQSVMPLACFGMAVRFLVRAVLAARGQLPDQHARGFHEQEAG